MIKTKIAIIVILIALGLLSSWVSFQYICHKRHGVVESMTTFEVPGIGKFSLVLKTADAFMANNPIDIYISSHPTFSEVEHVQFTFYGAESTKTFPRNNDFSQRVTSEEEPDEEFDRFLEAVLANHILLKKGTTNFSGEITKLVYHSGGDYSIGVMIGGHPKMTTVPPDFETRPLIHILPVETQLSIRTNQLMTGLAWLAIGITLLLPGITTLLDNLEDIAQWIKVRKFRKVEKYLSNWRENEHFEKEVPN